MDGNGLAGVVVVLELVVDLVDEGVDAGYSLELDASEDGALQRLRECLVYLGGTGELGSDTGVSGWPVENANAGAAIDGWRTSLSSASKNVRPEWPLMVQMKRFCKQVSQPSSSSNLHRPTYLLVEVQSARR